MDDRERRQGLRLERVHASIQWADGQFRNTLGLREMTPGGALPVLGELFFKHAQRKPPGPLPLERPLALWATRPTTGFRATWLGHSTVLLEMDGKHVLTDPVFGERVSPLRFIGPRRFHPVPASLDELPPLDAVLLSHDHYDHLCASTMQVLGAKGVPIVTSLGVGAHLERFGVAPDKITELDWGEHTEIAGVRFTAQPSQHFSGRGPTSRNRTLWSSWVIQSERRQVFFFGDTGLTPTFADLGRAHGPFGPVLRALARRE